MFRKLQRGNIQCIDRKCLKKVSENVDKKHTTFQQTPHESHMFLVFIYFGTGTPTHSTSIDEDPAI